MRNIFWTGYSYDDRHSAIDIIQNAISKYGNVVDFHLFSDMTMSMTIEIEELKVDKLYDELKQIIRIQESPYLKSSSKKERTVYLNITFARGKGDLRNEVPSVPG